MMPIVDIKYLLITMNAILSGLGKCGSNAVKQI